MLDSLELVDNISWRAKDRSWLGLYELVTLTRIFPASLRLWTTTKSQSATDGMEKTKDENVGADEGIVKVGEREVRVMGEALLL